MLVLLQIHCVRAFGSVHEALRELHIDVPVVLHSWTGSQEMVTTFGQLPRIYFSLSGSITKVPPEKAISMVGQRGIICALHAQGACVPPAIDGAWMSIASISWVRDCLAISHVVMHCLCSSPQLVGTRCIPPTTASNCLCRSRVYLMTACSWKATAQMAFFRLGMPGCSSCLLLLVWYLS